MINKKTYETPFVRKIEISSETIIAVSIIDGATADPDEPVLSKEDQNWDIWGCE